MKKIKKIYLESGIRSPFGLVNGILASKNAIDILGSILSSYKNDGIRHVLLDCALPAGLGYSPIGDAASFAAKIPTTLIKSGTLHSLFYAFSLMQSSDINNILVGGFESVSKAPYFIDQGLSRVPFGRQNFSDSVYHDALIDHPDNVDIAKIVEEVGADHKISRKEQEEYAYKDYEKVLSNLSLIGALIEGGNHDENLDIIEPGQFSAAVPLYKGGKITKNTMAPLGDGACVLKLSTEQGMASIKDVVIQAGKPASFIDVAIKAIDALCKKTGWSIHDVDFFEISENFAITPLAIARSLDIDPAIINVWGGALSLGHPFSASSARLVLTLAHQLRHYKQNKGMACLVSAKGETTAIALER